MLQKQKNLLEAVIETASDLIVTMNHSGQIQFSNQAIREILGFEAASIIGKKFSSFLAEPFDQEYESFIQDYFVRNDQKLLKVGRRIEARRADGTVIPVSVTLNEVLVDDEKYLSAVVRDIRKILNTEVELENRTRELARSNKELEQFAAVAAHDLQAPLRTMINMSGSLKKRYSDKLDETGLDYLARLEKSGIRLQTMISDLLTLSRIGNKEKELMPIDLNSVLKNVLSEISETVTESKAQITQDPLPIVLGDAGQIHQLLQNLILNALKFRKPDTAPQVHVSCKPQGKYFEICVQDNGIGIEEKYHSRIFGIFQRLHGKSEYPGSGIGLSICQKIVEGHGGKLWVESELDRGSNFKFFLRPAKTT